MSLQVLNTILVTAFGVLSLRVSERLIALRRDSNSWMFTGWAFLLTGMVAAVQNAWGAWALVEGAGSSVWEAYIRWTAAFNHSRTVALIFFGLLLLGSVALPVRTLTPPRPPRAVATIVGGLAVGGLIGWAEGAYVTHIHLTRVMALDTVEVVVLLLALFALLLRDRVDRLLWLALVTYAFKVAVNTLWSPDPHPHRPGRRLGAPLLDDAPPPGRLCRSHGHSGLAQA